MTDGITVFKLDPRFQQSSYDCGHLDEDDFLAFLFERKRLRDEETERRTLLLEVALLNDGYNTSVVNRVMGLHRATLRSELTTTTNEGETNG